MPLAAAGLVILSLAGALAFSRWETNRIEQRFPPQGRFVAVEGGRIHFTQRLPAGVPRATIVLLHGASGNQADIMNALGDRLAAKGYRVIAPDRPGHGWSDRILGRAAASPAVQAKLLREAFDAIGIKGAIIVGHSWSGALAVNFALGQPDFTQGLVLLAPATHPWASGVAWYNKLAGTPMLGDIFVRLVPLPVGLLQIEEAMRVVFAPQPVPPGYVEKTGAYMILRPAEFMANAQDVDGLDAFATVQALSMRAITVPTAIVTGDADGVVSMQIHSYGSFHAIPGATLTVLPGVGHSPHYADPQRVVAVIEEIVARSGR